VKALYFGSLGTGLSRAVCIGLLAALASCDGTLQFSESRLATGGSVPGDDASTRFDVAVDGDRSEGLAETSSDEAAGGDEDASEDVAPEANLPDGDAAPDAPNNFAPPCYRDADCPSSKLHCDLLAHTCVECLADPHCVVSPYGRCELSIQRCVQCLTQADCAQGATCDPATRLCILGCTGSGCPAAQPYCTRSICVECRTNADCPSAELCDPAIGRCAICADDMSCPAQEPRCDPFNIGRKRCKQCLTPGECSPDAPYCDLYSGLCMAKP
jgi:Cys-rich repeat protein